MDLRRLLFFSNLLKLNGRDNRAPTMHVISKKKLRDFWRLHPAAEVPLNNWHAAAKKARWKSFADVRRTFGSVDLYKQFLVFNVGGNKFRLIVIAHFNRGKLYVRHVLTHREYDAGKWKT
jgi:mRNA interferase HigB